MRLSPRIVVPAVAAVLLAAAASGVFYWQISSSVRLIEMTFSALKLRTSLPRSAMRVRPVAAYDAEEQSAALLALRQGELLELRGEWKQAEEQFALSVRSGGGLTAVRKLIGIQFQRREYDQARETIATLKREAHDADDEVLLLSGLLALRTGDLAGAHRIFMSKAGSPESEYGQALIAIAQGEHEAAKTHLSTVADGSNPTLRSYAQTLLTAYSEFSLFADGQDTHLATLLSRALAQVDECELALPLLQHVVAIQDSYRDAWIVKGYCEFSSERLTEALASLERAYAIDPEKPETQYFLARTHAALGDPKNAVTFLQYAIVNGFTPEIEARDLLAQYALELGDVGLALDQYKALAEKPSAAVADFEKFIDLAIHSPGHPQEAYDLAKQAVQKWPNDPLALTLRAEALTALGNTGQAQSDLQAALNIDPKFAKALEALDKLKNPLPISH